MLHVTLWAAAAISSEHVLAAMLTAMISITLINIFTVASSAVQGEAFLTITGETAGVVLADAPRSAQGWLSAALVIIDTRRLVLGKSGRTFAVEASDRVHTQELAVVLFG